jgi:ATP-dependent Lon protease
MLLRVMQLGLFPLQMVLLPTERVPLHIFEPRYRELIGECLAREAEFGLVLADERGLREIGTRARVAEVLERFPDGRLNIVVQGGERFRVLELTRGRAFQTAEVEELADEADGPPDEAVQRGLTLLGRLREATGSEVDEPDPSRGHLSYQLAARVDFGAEVKQQLLELRSEPRRLDIVCELLEGAIKTVELEGQVRERASGNGKVSLE